MKLFRVRVKTNQREETLAVTDNRIDVSVKAKPEQGAANERVIALIAFHFQLPVKNVRITKGHHSQSKSVSITP